MSLSSGIQKTAYSFRGYDTKNQGRTPELIAIPEYAELMRPHLDEASAECAKAVGRPVDLFARAKAGVEFELEDYAEAVAHIVAVAQAQLDILRECHGIDYKDGAFSFGFSLGEIAALVAGDCLKLDDALRVPLSLCEDGIELAYEVTLGVVFSRKERLSEPDVQNCLLRINQLGKGVIGISAHLSPNSVLVMGTGETMDLFKQRLKEDFPKGTNLRCNDNRWPPLHTPIVWEKDFTTRAARGMHSLPGGFSKPSPDILSLVTGEFSYDENNFRDLMRQWVDQPQRLWEVVCVILASEVETIVHVGPTPNIVPATFQRITKNVEAQTSHNRGIKALSIAVDRPWLRKLLPEKAALLRAPKIKHFVLEDWLIENAPK